MTFGSNTGVGFDGLLLTEKLFDLQSCETLKGHVFLHSVGRFRCYNSPVSKPVKLRHSPEPTLRVNSRVHITWLDKQQPRRKRRRRKKKTGKTDSMAIMHVCADPRNWESFEAVLNHLIGPINVFRW